MMRKKLLFTGFAAAVFWRSAAVLACGDKFVVLGRDALGRFFVTKYHATILIYVNPASHMPAAMKDFRLEATLKKAGHKPRPSTAPRTSSRRCSGKYDIVLADIRHSGCPEGRSVGGLQAAGRPGPLQAHAG